MLHVVPDYLTICHPLRNLSPVTSLTNTLQVYDIEQEDDHWIHPFNGHLLPCMLETFANHRPRRDRPRRVLQTRQVICLGKPSQTGTQHFENYKHGLGDAFDNRQQSINNVTQIISKIIDPQILKTITESIKSLHASHSSN